MCDYELFHIEVTKNYGIFEWREDLKKVSVDHFISVKPARIVRYARFKNAFLLALHFKFFIELNFIMLRLS